MTRRKKKVNQKKKKNIFISIIKGLVFGVFWIIASAWKVLIWIAEHVLKLIKEGRTGKEPDTRLFRKPEYESFIELKTFKGELNDFENELCQSKSKIGLVFGARGSGKSAVGMRILENIYAKTGRKTFALGFKKEDLPEWINVIKDVNDITNGSFLLADEGGIEFSSRKSMSKTNQLLSELLMISRHNDISVLFISQTSANIEINTLRQADYIILKQPSLLQLDFERKKIREIYSKVEGEFKKYEKDRGACYLYSHEYMGFISNMLPSFWNSKVSKGYRKIT
ncbi:MAG TPA: hypothetical protein VI912_01140 [Candidatus Bilamarchaeaceae archaeon]|nr:hypothetical protein [Candidatus Bilamarchaeaceae archaeon]